MNPVRKKFKALMRRVGITVTVVVVGKVMPARVVASRGFLLDHHHHLEASQVIKL